jgi:Na+/proline symporter
MVKKRVKKPAVKKARRPVKRKDPSLEIKRVRATPSRIKLVLRNLILFVILSLISYLLYIVFDNVIYETFFYFLTMILGFIALAFLISLVVFLVLRALRK